jgi:PAS domain-containing protein
LQWQTARLQNCHPVSPYLMHISSHYIFVSEAAFTLAVGCSEAEKQEELQEAAAATVSAQGDGTAAAILSQLDEKVDAVITISAHGKIQTANRVACRIFGYKKGEMDGQDVSILMPAPFSTRHNSYLRNYARTGMTWVQPL